MRSPIARLILRTRSSSTATPSNTTLSHPYRTTSRRNLTTSQPRATAWSPSPAPPRLPREEQEIFEQLQRQSTGAFSTPLINQSPLSTTSPSISSSSSEQSQQGEVVAATSSTAQTEDAPLRAKVPKGEELHPNIRRGAPPEFEGDTNPKTGEMGGPKNEPLRWGSGGDWSYNGRATDF